jgi:hypothetical protein
MVRERGPGGVPAGALQLAERAYDYHETFTNGSAAALEGALRLFAQAYADHPDYRPEWAPDA